MTETLFIDDLAALKSITDVVARHIGGKVLAVFATHESEWDDLGRYCVALEGRAAMFEEISRLPAFASDESCSS